MSFESVINLIHGYTQWLHAIGTIVVSVIVLYVLDKEDISNVFLSFVMLIYALYPTIHILYSKRKLRM